MHKCQRICVITSRNNTQQFSRVQRKPRLMMKRWKVKKGKERKRKHPEINKFLITALYRSPKARRGLTTNHDGVWSSLSTSSSLVHHSLLLQLLLLLLQSHAVQAAPTPAPSPLRPAPPLSIVVGSSERRGARVASTTMEGGHRETASGREVAPVGPCRQT